jgi:carotenoid cleavage dioxygenase-like enzyme
VRNGPNPQFKEAVYETYHWFDGDGMLHGVRFEEDGSVSYVNRWVETERWKEEKAFGEPVHPRLGSIREPLGLLKMVVGGVLSAVGLRPKLRGRGTANTALVYHDGRLMALVESDAPEVIKLPYLETLGRHDYEGKLNHPFTAHPKVDPVTGELMFFGYRFDKKPYVSYSLVDREGRLVSTLGLNSIEVPVMMHDFACSENFSVIMELPFTFRIERALQGEPPFQFEPQRNSRFALIPRHATRESQIVWFTAKPCFVFHTVNCWEEGDEVVLLACRSEATSSLGLSPSSEDGEEEEEEGVVLKGQQQQDSKRATKLYEWRFHLKSLAVKERVLDDLRVEFPVINESLLGRKTRYAYAAHFTPSERPLMDAVVKYDLLNSSGGTSAKILRYGEHKFGGECVFVPRQPTAGGEDDGYLLTFVFDESSNESELWVMDAREFGKVLTKIHIPRRVPYGFHGKWISNPQILTQKPFPLPPPSSSTSSSPSSSPSSSSSSVTAVSSS